MTELHDLMDDPEDPLHSNPESPVTRIRRPRPLQRWERWAHEVVQLFLSAVVGVSCAISPWHVTAAIVMNAAAMIWWMKEAHNVPRLILWHFTLIAATVIINGISLYWWSTAIFCVLLLCDIGLLRRYRYMEERDQELMWLQAEVDEVMERYGR